MEGNVYLFDSINGNLNGSFHLVDTVLRKDYGYRIGYNLSVSGGDINGDGLSDMIIGLYGGGIKLFYQDGPLAVNELHNSVNSLYIYPNPLTSSSILQLNTQLKDAEVVIYDMLGKEMLRSKLTGNRMEIKRGNLESGVYFIKVSTKERQWVNKMVVE